MKILPIGASCVAMLLATTLGCTSPLKSSDPAVRARAVAELSDDKELFFIAMNVGVYIGQKSGSYYNAFLTEEHYLDDVRVAAVNRLSGIDWILKCATWQDGCVYVDSGMEQGRLEYKGENYYTHDSRTRLQQKVHPGDVVRDAAKKRLKLSAAGKSLAGDIKTRLFPSASHWTGSRYSDSGETAFVDTYGQIKNNNPFDIVMCDLVDAENSSSEIVTFLMVASSGGPVLTPNAYGKALRKLNGIDSETAKKLFRKLFIGSEDSDSNEKIEIRQRRSASVAKASTVENPSKDWPWLVYQHIDDPEVEIIKTALALSDNTAREKIL